MHERNDFTSFTAVQKLFVEFSPFSVGNWAIFLCSAGVSGLFYLLLTPELNDSVPGLVAYLLDLSGYPPPTFPLPLGMLSAGTIQQHFVHCDETPTWHPWELGHIPQAPIPNAA